MGNDQPTVLITGGSRGLGLGIAKDLVSDHRVITVARNSPEQPDQRIDHRTGFDLANRECLEMLTDDLSACDVLINNAGIAHDGILATQSIEDVEEMLQVNLTGSIHLTKLYLRERLAVRKRGIVVTIGSIVSQRGYRGLAVYSATKAALSGMTRALAREMGSKGFRLNMVLPGFLETDMSGALDADKRNQIVRRTPMGRLGSVEDVTPLVRFLISPGAAYITGQEFIVDGGLTS